MQKIVTILFSGLLCSLLNACGSDDLSLDDTAEHYSGQDVSFFLESSPGWSEDFIKNDPNQAPCWRRYQTAIGTDGTGLDTQFCQDREGTIVEVAFSKAVIINPALFEAFKKEIVEANLFSSLSSNVRPGDYGQIEDAGWMRFTVSVDGVSKAFYISHTHIFLPLPLKKALAAFKGIGLYATTYPHE